MMFWDIPTEYLRVVDNFNDNKSSLSVLNKNKKKYIHQALSICHEPTDLGARTIAMNEDILHAAIMLYFHTLKWINQFFISFSRKHDLG